MGTSFVTLTRIVTGKEPGFWMQDTMLELWLRLLALHLPESTNDGQYRATVEIRNQWLLASKGYFVGCVPHHLEEACANDDGRVVVRMAIDSLLKALRESTAPLDHDTMNLFAIEYPFRAPIERIWFEEIGQAFLDLLDGKITDGASSKEIMPGSKPYKRDIPNE